MKKIEKRTYQAIEWLKKLIEIPSVSGNETEAADFLANILERHIGEAHRIKNNVWCRYPHFNEQKPALLLNSHIDTVKPTENWTKNPYKAYISDRKLYGLGANDAGASLVSLLSVFLFFKEDKKLPFNLVFGASAEEEITGKNGIALLLEKTGKIDAAIVGEPTGMKMAIAEKGLLVLDAEVHGKAGHAAHNEGENAIYKAIKDIEWFRNYRFPKESPTLGEVKMSVTQIEAGYKHNVVPDICRFVVDIRTTDQYTNSQIFDEVVKQTNCKLKARSLDKNSSGIAMNHPLVKAGIDIGLSYFGSPTLSDQTKMTFPSVKAGPGDSARSHTADEFVFIDEIHHGIETYIRWLQKSRTTGFIPSETRTTGFIPSKNT